MAGGVRPDLVGNGTLTAQYGTYVFSPAAKTENVQAKTIESKCGRAVTHTIYTFTITDYVSNVGAGANGGTNSFMDTLRQQLELQAAPFKYTDEGFGAEFSVNVVGRRDCVFGPKGRVIGMNPVGGGNAWRFTWTCEVALLKSGAAGVAFGNVMESTFTVSVASNEAGTSTRTINGMLRIPQGKNSPDAVALNDCAANYIERVVPRLLPGFRRRPHTWDVDESKCVLHWTVVDEELPSNNVPPPYVVKAKVTHNLDTNDVSFLNWTGNLSATYQFVKGVPPGLGYKYFKNLVQDRIFNATQQAQALSVIPVKLSFSEPDAHDNPTFSASMVYTYTTTIGGLLGALGLFRVMRENDPTQDNTWQQWSDSLASSAFHPRGIAKLQMKAADDAIVTIDHPNIVLPTSMPVGLNRKGQAINTDWTVNKPPPEKSWVEYENACGYAPVYENGILKYLPQNPVAQAVVRAIPYLSAITPGVAIVQTALAASVAIQRRAPPTWYASIRGGAIRAGYEIPQPQLVSIGGATATPANLPGYGFWSKLAGNWGGVAIYAAIWHLRFVLSGQPKVGTGSPANAIVKDGRTNVPAGNAEF